MFDQTVLWEWVIMTSRWLKATTFYLLPSNQGNPLDLRWYFYPPPPPRKKSSHLRRYILLPTPFTSEVRWTRRSFWHSLGVNNHHPMHHRCSPSDHPISRSSNPCPCCWLVRVSLLITSGSSLTSCPDVKTLWQFYDSRPSLSCIQWLEVVYRMNAVMTSFSFYNVTRKHLDYIHDVIFGGLEFHSWSEKAAS